MKTEVKGSVSDKNTLLVNSEDQIIQSGNCCYSSLRVASIDEIEKREPIKPYL